MPAYNAERYLKRAVDSILQQTFTNFELLLINDGSKDGSKDIIAQYAKQDSRVVAINQENMGLVETLRKGIDLAKGVYIARMDADDISTPRRLEIQNDMLDKNPKLVLASSCFESINEYDEFERINIAPSHSDDLKRTLRLYNPIAHGATTFRKDAYLKTDGYSNSVGPVEDYHLWCQLAEVGDIACSEKALFRWRMNPEGITHTQNNTQRDSLKKLLEEAWEKHPIESLSSSELRRRGGEYIDLYGARGVIMKEIMLEDNYHLGVKSIKYGNSATGLRLITAIFFTGRTGAKITLRKTLELLKAKLAGK